MIQDIFPHKLENQYRPEAQPEQDSYVLCYRGAEVLLKDGEMLPTVSEVLAEHYRYLFQIDNRSYFLPETPVSENDAMQDSRNTGDTAVSAICDHDRKASGGLVQKYSLLRQLRRRSAPLCGTACHGLRSLP